MKEYPVFIAVYLKAENCEATHALQYYEKKNLSLHLRVIYQPPRSGSI